MTFLHRVGIYSGKSTPVPIALLITPGLSVYSAYQSQASLTHYTGRHAQSLYTGNHINIISLKLFITDLSTSGRSTALTMVEIRNLAIKILRCVYIQDYGVKINILCTKYMTDNSVMVRL